MLQADKAFLGATLVILAFCVVAMLAMRQGAINQCEKYAEATGRQTKFESGACYVKHSDGEWYLKGERR